MEIEIKEMKVAQPITPPNNPNAGFGCAGLGGICLGAGVLCGGLGGFCFGGGVFCGILC